MNRQTRTLAVIGIAIVMASIASLFMYRAIQRIPVREVEVANYHVVVAAKPLSMGARIAEGDVKVVAWPVSNPIANAHKDASEVVGRGLLAAVEAGDPLTDTKLAPLAAGAGLPPSIPAGMRAMSVKVNEVVGVAGFVVPGTRVDILVTLNRQEDSMTRTVASNVQVLTAGTRYDQQKAKDGQPIPSTVVTLMVTPQDAERITLAQAQGQVMLSLRNPLDTGSTETGGVSTEGLFGRPAPTAPIKGNGGRPRPAGQPAAPGPVATPAGPYTVEAIRGAKRTTEEVKQAPDETKQTTDDDKPGTEVVKRTSPEVIR